MTTPRKPGAKQRHGRSKGITAPDAETMSKQQQAVDLAIAGELTYAEIAEQVGYAGESSVRAAIDAVFRRAANTTVEEMRPRLVARAERMWAHGFAVMVEGRTSGDMDKFKAGAAVADRSFGRLAKLYGLDTPEVSVHIGGGGELDKIKAEFAALMGGDVVDAEVIPEGTDDENT